LGSLRYEGVPLLVLDAGDLLFPYPSLPEGQREQLTARSELMFLAYRKMGLDAFAPGELDFLLGKNFLLSKATETAFLSANILDKATKKPLFTPSIIKEVAGVRVGIFGLIDQNLNLGPAQGDVEIEDSTSSARKAVESLKAQQADLIIGLTHLGFSLDQKLARDVDGIDIIIGGHTGMRLDKPTRIGKTIVCQAPMRGQYLGRLDLTLVGRAPYTLQDASEGKKIAKRISTYINSMIPLEATMKPDNEIEKLVTAYKEDVQRIQRAQMAQPVTSPAQLYRGERSCRKCHAKIFSFQKKSKHAKAFATLRKVKRHLDAQCIGCHTTGFQKPGGFLLPVMVEDMKNDMKNVQCEACHGPAQGHNESPLVSKPFTPVRQETCRSCHTPKWDPRFNFTAKLRKVACTGALTKTVH